MKASGTHNEKVSRPQTSVAEGFALMLESACRDFETLAKIIRREITLVATDGKVDGQTLACINMALAKSFVFHTVRAGRICEHGNRSLAVARDDRRSFLKALEPILKVRDVNEHGFDPESSGRGKKSRPSLHRHPGENAAGDETSLIIFDDRKILMGPLNLYEVYGPVNRMRELAGFMKVRHRITNLP